MPLPPRFRGGRAQVTRRDGDAKVMGWDVRSRRTLAAALAKCQPDQGGDQPNAARPGKSRGGEIDIEDQPAAHGHFLQIEPGRNRTMSRAYNCIDADGHILEPLELWAQYMD